MSRELPVRAVSPAPHLLLAVSLWLSACGSATPLPAATPSPSQRPPTATFTPVPTETAEPTSSPTPFVPKGTIRIASLGPLSGEYADAGKGLMRGAFLAVKDFAGPLQDLGYELKLESFDDRMDSRAAVAHAHAIVDNPEILCGVGPYSSRIFNEVELIYHNAGLAFIGPSTTAAFVTSSGYPEISRVVGRHDAQGAAGARFAQEQGFSRVAILSDGTPYSRFNAYHFTEEASGLGLTVTSNTTTSGVRDFGSLVGRMLADEVELVYFSSLNLQQVGTFFREARSAGYTGTFFGPDAIDNPKLLDFSGTSLVTGGGTYYTAMAAPASGYPGAADFVATYTDLYGEPPPLYSAEAYDAAAICINSVLQAMESKGGELPTRSEVASAVRAQDGFAGITGTYQFDRNGDPDPARYYVYQLASASPVNWPRNVLIASYELAPPS